MHPWFSILLIPRTPTLNLSPLTVLQSRFFPIPPIPPVFSTPLSLPVHLRLLTPTTLLSVSANHSFRTPIEVSLRSNRVFFTWLHWQIQGLRVGGWLSAWEWWSGESGRLALRPLYGGGPISRQLIERHRLGALRGRWCSVRLMIANYLAAWKL